MSTKRTGAGTWESDGTSVWTESNSLIATPGHSIPNEERKQNSRFIVLADHHFEAMRETLEALVDWNNKRSIDQSWWDSAANILKAIKAEENK